MPFDYVRKLVSGNKARFIDAAGVNLDLVYVTDRIIIMGYPATGLESLYRNRRRDVLKFISSRHGQKWWVWNLCPLFENSYSPESMRNRVSRYPFPDHHPPPLPLLPLAVREMTAWLDGDSERIAIIHCKAGKGRSGTLLCSYLLSLPELPSVPQLDRSYTHAELLKRIQARAVHELADESEEDWVAVEDHHDDSELEICLSPPIPANDTQISLVDQNPTAQSQNPTDTTESILALTTSSFIPIAVGDEDPINLEGQHDRRDGRVDEVFKFHSIRRMKQTSNRRGVSIPSQRRWCRYIHLLLKNQAPQSYLCSVGQVRLLSATVVMSFPSKWQKPFASLVVGGTGGAGQGKAWASVARYNDDYVAELQRRGGDGQGLTGEISWGGVGGEGSFDMRRMFQTCGKLVPEELDPTIKTNLRPHEQGLVLHHLVPHRELLLDRFREFRLKLHLSSLPLGWAWFIPAFHIPESSKHSSGSIHILDVSRSQIDFAIGPGSAIRRMLVQLQEV